MKILCIGDVHIKADNLDMIDEVETKILDILKKSTVGEFGAIVLLGDILHTHERLHVLALNRAYLLFRKLLEYAPLYVIVGNHDYIQNDQFLTTNHWMNALKEWPNLTIVDTVIKRENLVFVPYVPTGRFLEALNTIGDSWKTAKYIFAHQEFEGARMKTIVSYEGDKWDKKYPLVISGHIHGRQTLECGVEYSGSLLGSDKAYLLSLDTNKLGMVQNIILNYTKKKHVNNIAICDLNDDILHDANKVTIYDKYQTYLNYTKTAKYNEYVKRGVKFCFKPILDTIQAVGAVSNSVQNYTNLIYDIVLGKEDPFLYCALEKVVRNVQINETDILIIPVKDQSM